MNNISPAILVAPSILNCDFLRLGQELQSISQADMVHVDVMDGAFVPNISFGVPLVEAIARGTQLPLDVHLMIEKPEKYIEVFAKAGSHIITIHKEATKHVKYVIDAIKSLGKKAGVSINPNTPVEEINPILPYVDLVLIMSVYPGFGGQSFITDTYARLDQLITALDSWGITKRPLISVDGGVGQDNIGNLWKHGANTFVVGTSVIKSADKADAIRRLRKCVESVQ